METPALGAALALPVVQFFAIFTVIGIGLSAPCRSRVALWRRPCVNGEPGAWVPVTVDPPELAMKLDINGTKEIDDPAKETLRAAVESLDAGTSGSGFVVLSSDKMTYIQSSGDSMTGFDLEYQEGSLKRHYRAGGVFTADQVVDILWDYACGGSEWEKAAQRGGEPASTETAPARRGSIKERMLARGARLPTRFQLVVAAAFVATIATIAWEKRKGSRAHPTQVGPEVPVLFVGCIAFFFASQAYEILKTGRAQFRYGPAYYRDRDPFHFWAHLAAIFIFCAAGIAFVAVVSSRLRH